MEGAFYFVVWTDVLLKAVKNNKHLIREICRLGKITDKQ